MSATASTAAGAMLPATPPAPAPSPAPVSPLLTAPVLPTLVRLALPNVLSLVMLTAVVVAETSYIGVLGTEPLAAMALVFPMIMLTQQMSSGAMGGGVSSAVARALGARDHARARALAFHALVIGACGGLLFMALFLSTGPLVYRLLGGKGEVYAHALAYSNTLFSGVIVIWLLNTLASIVRGTGNMRVPSATFVGMGVLQIVLGGSLSLGLGPMPRLGLVGVALGQVLSYGAGALVLYWFLRSGHAALRIGAAGISLKREMFIDILKVGAVACLSSLMSVTTTLIAARLVAGYGTEALAGYGIGTRLEFLLIPIAFAFGTACVPMVGMAIGAGNVARARKVAWTGAALSGAIIGAIGLVVVALPDLWARLFSSDPAVLAAARQFLRWAGPGFPFFGFGLCLYFASQGSGRVLGVVAASSARLLVVGLGGWLMLRWGASFAAIAWLIGFAHVCYGLSTAGAVKLTRWGR
jgi:putative MATE family efflux protein